MWLTKRASHILCSRDVRQWKDKAFSSIARFLCKWNEGEDKLGVLWNVVLSIITLSWLVLVWKGFTQGSILHLTADLCLMDIESLIDWVCVTVKRLAIVLCLKCSWSLSVYFLFPKIISVGFLELLLQTQQDQREEIWGKWDQNTMQPDMNLHFSHEHHSSTYLELVH